MDGAIADGTARPIALVTGAGSGIGRATARLLAQHGYRVGVNDVHDGRASSVAAEVNGFPCPADVSDAEAVEAMVRAIEGSLGPISVAVCNAGFSGASPLASVDDDLWRRSLRVSLGGCFHVARAVVPAMREMGDGCIITISSELGLVGAVNLAHYVSAKSAVLGFTRALAREVAPRIRVNCVAPGPTDTPLLSDRFRSAEYLNELPMGRLGTPDEIAETIVFLAEAQWITGQVLSPNGGAVIQ